MYTDINEMLVPKALKISSENPYFSKKNWLLCFLKLPCCIAVNKNY